MKPAYAIIGSTGDYAGSEEIWHEAVTGCTAAGVKMYVETRPRDSDDDDRSYVMVVDVVFGKKHIGQWRYASSRADDRSGAWEKWES